MSTVRVYRSTDPGAPPHPSATRGSMAALIRACLVAGYGNIAVDGITVAGGIATATITNNVLEVGTVIEISGATPAELNAEWKITAADSGSVTFATPGIADVTATGTIGASIPAAGWEEPYAESGNYACFRALDGNKKFYQIDDNMADADVAYSRVYDSMSDVLTGVELRGESYFGKRANGTDSYSTVWIVVADEKTCYVALRAQYGFVLHGFGDIVSFTSPDPDGFFLAGHPRSDYMTYFSNMSLADGNGLGSSSPSFPFNVGATLTGLKAAGVSHAVASLIAFSGVSGVINSLDKCSTPAAESGISYPVVPATVFCTDPAELLSRGRLPGLYYPMAFKPVADMSILDVGGKTMIALDLGGSGSNDNYEAQAFIDLTEWY